MSSNSTSPPWLGEVLFEDTAFAPYTWYDFDDASALNKVLVKTPGGGGGEPVDIASVSDVVKALRPESRIQRAYAPRPDQAEELERILAPLAAESTNAGKAVESG